MIKKNSNSQAQSGKPPQAASVPQLGTILVNLGILPGK